jgi:hypothetical protein
MKIRIFRRSYAACDPIWWCISDCADTPALSRVGSRKREVPQRWIAFCHDSISNRAGLDWKHANIMSDREKIPLLIVPEGCTWKPATDYFGHFWSSRRAAVSLNDVSFAKTRKTIILKQDFTYVTLLKCGVTAALKSPDLQDEIRGGRSVTNTTKFQTLYSNTSGNDYREPVSNMNNMKIGREKSDFRLTLWTSLLTVMIRSDDQNWVSKPEN